VLLPNCTAQIATDVIGRLRQTVTNNRTCSVGLATRQPGESAENVIARADQALYQAKAHGRDRVDVSTPPEALPTPSSGGSLLLQ